MFICEKDMHCVEMDCPIYNPEETCDHMIEVEPVKTGYWTRSTKIKKSWQCSCCLHYSALLRSPFCPMCGAKMSGG